MGECLDVLFYAISNCSLVGEPYAISVTNKMRNIYIYASKIQIQSWCLLKLFFYLFKFSCACSVKHVYEQIEHDKLVANITIKF